jgi:molecular chaperone HtpG
VADIRLTKRLTNSAAVLVADANTMNANMERILKRHGEAVGNVKRVLELNPDHAAVVALKDLQAKDATDRRIGLFGHLLYEQAVVAEGSKIADPAGFAGRINELIAASAKG